jgi:uncharacterized integral membrane protein (TIGR00698 family)
LALAAAVALLAGAAADLVGRQLLSLQGAAGAKGSPISGIALAVLVGLLLSNVARLPPVLKPGLDFAIKKVLRLGIILVGIKLSIVDVLKVGSLGIPLVAGIVGFGIATTLLLARSARVSRSLAFLAAASTAICGITAALAVAPTVEASDEEVAYTVANVTLFGLLGMLVYPYVAHALFGTVPGAAGLFLGTAIHDTSQVMGAALSYQQLFGDERAAQVATVAKLTRNSLLVAVVPLLGYLHQRGGSTGGARGSLRKLFPMFVLGFVALAAVRTAGDMTLAGQGHALGLFPSSTWHELTKLIGERVAGLLLGTALAAVGLTTRLEVFRGLGPRPFVIGMSAAAAVSLASVFLASMFGHFLG